MLAEGQRLVETPEERRAKHVINPNGTVTGRASFKPNLAQVPATRAPYGKQCRELLTVPPTMSWSALTRPPRAAMPCALLNDGGDYAKEVIDGDVHTATWLPLDLPLATAKTFIYALLYGAGNAKIGSIVGGDAAAGARLRQPTAFQLGLLRAVLPPSTTRVI